MAVRGKLACLFYRVSHRLDDWGVPAVPSLLFHLNALLNGCEIHFRARIGRGLVIAHPNGVVIGRNVRIGDGFSIYTGAVVGVLRTGEGTQPRIGNHVVVYAGAKLLGPIQVGDHSVIGANAVVTRDVPAGATVAGIPARIVRECATSFSEASSSC